MSEVIVLGALPSQVECEQFHDDVFLYRAVVPWGQDLIDEAERALLWNRSSQVNAYGKSSFKTENRSSCPT